MTALDEFAQAVIAIDVGGTDIKASLSDSAGNVLDLAERPTPVTQGPDAVVASVRQVARDLQATAGRHRHTVMAAAVVAPGIVDSVGGIARFSVNIGWTDVPLRTILSKDLGVPVAVAHDVEAAGIAERQLGQAREVPECLVVVIGTGIAAVVIAGGEIQRGATGAAGELGHLQVYRDGEPCACGQSGCLEAYASASAIARRYAAAAGHEASAKEIAGRLHSDDFAARVWQQAAEALGIALASYTMLLDPALIVISGGLAEAGDHLLAPVRSALEHELTWHARPRLTLSRLGRDAGRLGATILAWQVANT